MRHDRKRAFDALWSWVGRESASRLIEVSDEIIEDLDASFSHLDHDQKTDVYLGYRQALSVTDNLEIWELGSLLSGFTLGDDSFRDFQRWLILQGKAVFTTAITLPDNIASFLRGRDDVPDVDVYSMGILDEFEDRFSLSNGIPMSGVVWGASDSSSERIRRNLPRLWDLLGNTFNWSDSGDDFEVGETPKECEIPGIGIVRVGDKLRHKARGTIAVVLAIQDPSRQILEVDRGGGYTASCNVTSDVYERLP